MKHIKQPCGSTGCGIAVMAMLQDKTYSETQRWAIKHGYCDTKERVNLAQMKRAIDSIFQCSVNRKKMLVPESDALFIVCHGRWRDKTNGPRHWIIFNRGEYFDPSQSSGVTRDMPSGFYIDWVFQLPAD